MTQNPADPTRASHDSAIGDDGEPRRSQRWAEALPFSTRRELRVGERVVWRRRGWQLAARSAAAAVATLGGVGLVASWLDREAPALAHAFGGVLGLSLSLLGLVGLAGVCVARHSGPFATSAGPTRPRIWPRVGALVAVALTVFATAWAPADALSSLWLRTPWVAIVLLGTGSAALAVWQRLGLLARGHRLFADLRAATVDVYSDGVARVDVLPRSRIVIARNGSAAGHFALTRTAEIAAPQPHAFRTSLPRGIVRAGVDANTRLQRRGLTVDERREIDGHIHRLRRAAWPSVASLFAVALVLGLRMLDNPDWHNLVDVVAIGWYALGAVAVVGYARRFAAARKLELDRDLRWVVTVDDVSPRASGVARLEVLPVSHLAWTQDAAPAQWRLYGA